MITLVIASYAFAFFICVSKLHASNASASFLTFLPQNAILKYSYELQGCAEQNKNVENAVVIALLVALCIKDYTKSVGNAACKKPDDYFKAIHLI